MLLSPVLPQATKRLVREKYGSEQEWFFHESVSEVTVSQPRY